MVVVDEGDDVVSCKEHTHREVNDVCFVLCKYAFNLIDLICDEIAGGEKTSASHKTSNG